jgi:hypothetical protein
LDNKALLSVALEDRFTEVLNVQAKIVGFKLAIILYFDQLPIVN